MNPQATVPSVFDMNNLTALKGAVRKDDPKALKSAAQQFEALFMQMVLKSMRDATPHESMFDSEQTRMYESLLDQQLAQVMSAKGSMGLAALIEKQLARGDVVDPQNIEGGLPLNPPSKAFPLDPTERRMPLDGGGQVPRQFPLDKTLLHPGQGAALPTGIAQMAAVGEYVGTEGATASTVARDFAAKLLPQATETSRTTGIPVQFLIAQAALETGWGRAEPRLADGRPSYNVFGIKAGRNWNGPVVEATTTEFVDGVPQRQTERFRAYTSYADAFRDYANLMRNNPRYAGIGANGDAVGFARGLQRAGYATDPAYADKLVRIIASPALRQAMAG